MKKYFLVTICLIIFPISAYGATLIDALKQTYSNNLELQAERKNLENREDDKEKIAIKRYEMYEKNIEPVIEFYKQTKLLTVVNGEKSITEISDEISDLIEGIKG